jgi:hypothetical protein
MIVNSYDIKRKNMIAVAIETGNAPNETKGKIDKVVNSIANHEIAYLNV